MVDFPDISDFEMMRRIESTVDRLIILWFSKVHKNIGSWEQVQVTLVNARLNMANIEISHVMPKVQSYEVSEKQNDIGRKILFNMIFDNGVMCFESEAIVYSRYSRRIQFAPDACQ